MAAIKEIVGESVLGQNGDVDVETLCKDQTAIGLYFSAHWCPPCRGFTPVLKEFYQNMKDKGNKFEVIFVSSDRDEKSFLEYFGDMPWHAVKYDGKRMDIGKKYSVAGIPCLIILGPDGNILNKNAREAVTKNNWEGVVDGSTK